MLDARTNLRGSGNSSNSKILAIEDDLEVLHLYKSYLQKRGYEVLSATGAIDGSMEQVARLWFMASAVKTGPLILRSHPASTRAQD